MADADPSHETLVPSPQSRSSAFDAERPQTVDRGGNFLAARERQITGYALGNQPLESALSDLHLNQTKQFANRTHAVHQPAVGDPDQRDGDGPCLRGIDELFERGEVHRVTAQEHRADPVRSGMWIASQPPAPEKRKAVRERNAGWHTAEAELRP